MSKPGSRVGLQAPRQPYAPPHLRCFGSIAQITRQHSRSVISDAGANRMAPFPS